MSGLDESETSQEETSQSQRSTEDQVRTTTGIYCLQGNICPFFIFAPFALVSDCANSNIFNYLPLNTTVS